MTKYSRYSHPARREGASDLDSQISHHVARLSELSRRVIHAAEQLAATLGHSEVGVGHLLLVMVQETRSPTSQWLYDSGLDEDRLRAGLAQGDMRLLVSIDHTLGQVSDLATRVGSHYIGTEHLLLSLLADPAGSTALAAYGAAAVLRHRLKAT